MSALSFNTVEHAAQILHASVPAAFWRRRVQLIVAARDDLLAQSVTRSSWR